MELKKGYKQTEIGIIPNDWDVKSYGETFQFLNTATYSRAELSQHDEIFYIHYGDIHTRWNFYLDFDKNILPTITNDKEKNYSLILDGDLVMADASEDYSGIGKSVEIKNVGNKKVISGLHTFLFRDVNKTFVDGYRGYIHTIKIVKKQFDELATGMKVYGVSKNNLKKVLIPTPTKAEQTAIATALSDMDDLINSLSTLIEKKKAIKQGVMQELLKPNPDSNQEGWEMKKLVEVVEIRKGQLITDSTRVDGNVPVIAGGKSPAYYHDKANRNGKTITISGSGASAGYVAFHNYPIFASDCSTIEEHKDYSVEYIFYLLQHMQERIYKLQTGGAQPHIHPSDLYPLEVPIPKKETQEKIATILLDMDNEIQSLKQNLTKYQMLKQGMMQELLTGKSRLV